MLYLCGTKLSVFKENPGKFLKKFQKDLFKGLNSIQDPTIHGDTIESFFDAIQMYTEAENSSPFSKDEIPILKDSSKGKKAFIE
jgi:hypothetical protein